MQREALFASPATVIGNKHFEGAEKSVDTFSQNSRLFFKISRLFFRLVTTNSLLPSYTPRKSARQRVLIPTLNGIKDPFGATFADAGAILH